MTAIVQYFKTKWGIKSTFDFIVIMIVFALTGSTSVYLKDFFFHILGISSDTAFIIRFVAYIGTIMPSYFILLLAYAFVLGKFRFFWEFEKKMFRRRNRRGKK